MICNNRCDAIAITLRTKDVSIKIAQESSQQNIDKQSCSYVLWALISRKYQSGHYGQIHLEGRPGGG